MDAAGNFEHYRGFINSQLQMPHTPSSELPGGLHRRVITISRQAGAGAHAVAEELVSRLQGSISATSRPWAIFDRNLVERVLKDHDLPERLERFMPEDRVSEMSDTLDALFGLHPSHWTLVRQTADTILHLAELGNIIVIGRGANIVTNKLDYAFHVRLVGSTAKRVEHLREYKHLSFQEAAAFVRDKDLARMRYVKKYFAKDIDDPLLYHLVINTDLVSYEETARLIAEAVSANAATRSLAS
jgi:cytidylate kinase